MGRLSTVMAGCFALAAFAVAILAGLSAGNSATLVLTRALLAMLVCYPIGFIVGMVCTHVIELHRVSGEKKDASSEDSADAEAANDEDVIVV